MSEFKSVTFDRFEFADLLGLDSDEAIERVEVAFSPMMQEWSLLVELASDPSSGEKTPVAVAEGHDGECDCVACELIRAE